VKTDVDVYTIQRILCSFIPHSFSYRYVYLLIPCPSRFLIFFSLLFYVPGFIDAPDPNFQFFVTVVLTIGRTYKLSHTPTVVQGWGGGGTPLLGFCCVTIFRKAFAFSRKPVMCSTR